MEDIKTQTGGHYTSEREHEASDVNVRAIVGFGVFLVVSGILCNVLLYGMYLGLEKWGDTRDPAPNPMVEEAIKKNRPDFMDLKQKTPADVQFREMYRLQESFPYPRLQVNEYAEYDNYKKDQMEVLNSYSWINKDAGTVRIPIERAMEIIAERGMPKAAAGAPGAAPKEAPLSKKLAAKPSGK